MGVLLNDDFFERTLSQLCPSIGFFNSTCNIIIYLRTLTVVETKFASPLSIDEIVARIFLTNLKF